MSAAPKRPRKAREAHVRWKFEDGRNISVPLVEVEVQLQRQYHAMANSNDPALREAGRRLARVAAEQAAAKQLADVQAVAAARRPRAGAGSKAKQRVQAVMRPYKAGSTSFKVFMQAWECAPIGGLRLTPLDGNRYEIDDENADGAPTRYQSSTLEKMYSGSAP